MLLVQALQSGEETVQTLADKYAIKISGHKKYPNLQLFKYDQLESPFSEPIVRECRGVILDMNEDWRVISYPFSKFFNNGEGLAAKIDWSTAEVFEKLDGSLIQMYWYEGEWHVATSGTPDASGQVNGFGFTFSELFWKTFNDMGLPLPPYQDVDYTFMFELMTPYNRVVVDHKESKLALIGKRNRFSGQEVHLSQLRGNCHYPVVQSYPLTSFEEIAATFSKLDPTAHEGYVVCDANFNRVKEKNPAYVAIHHIKDGMSHKRIADIVRLNEHSEVLTKFPEFEKEFQRIKDNYDGLIQELEDDYAKIKHLATQKEFALEACKCRVPDALFFKRKNPTATFPQYLAQVTTNRAAELIG